MTKIKIRDKNDQAVLGTAIAADAILITRDKDLLVLGWKTILTPEAFLSKHLKDMNRSF